MRQILSYILVFLPLLVFSQQGIPVRIEWTGLQTQTSVRDMQLNYYSFNGAVTHSNFGSLPVFYTRIQRPDPLFEYEATLKIIETDTLSPAVSSKLTDADLIQSAPAISIGYTGNMAEIYVLPLYADNQIVRLQEFELTLDLVPVSPEIKNPTQTKEYASESVLNSGRWFKIGITRTGIHSITYEDLSQMGIDPSVIEPEQLGIYGNYNGMLPEANEKYRADDLTENAIYLAGMNDGSFDPEDYVLFFAKGPTTWRYNYFTGRYDHSTNIYTDTTYYFFTPDAGNNRRIETIQNSTDEPSETINYFIDYALHERELENLIYSGKEWFGEQFTGDTLERTYTFNFPGLLKNRPVFLDFELVARGLIHTYTKVLVNGETVIDSARINRISTNSSIYANRAGRRETFFSDSDQLEIKVQYLTEDKNATAWLNYLALNVERELRYRGGQMGFREPHVTAAGNITRFEVAGMSGNNIVWDISDPFLPALIDFDLNDDTAVFTVPTEMLKDYIIFNSSELYHPVSFEELPNQNLHGVTSVNYVIISPENFLDQAERLARLHEENDGLQSLVVTPEQVYNEFSSGSQDITAIRDFMRFLWNTGAFGSEPGYLLLFGDASYDYKHRIHENTNIIPTYQSDESLRVTGSFVTDDYFGLLDDNEGNGASGILDIGIGRFPVATPEQAKIAVDKITHYMSKSLDVMHGWRNNICFIADDGDKNLHMSQAKLLISIADTLHAGINVNKIFSDAHTQVSVPGGSSYPDVNQKIIRQVEEGAQIINYTGHGGLIGWSDELILDVPAIRAFQNYHNMPLFITATCEFSRFDDPEFISAGEYVFLNEHGGGIALLTTTRLAYAHANILVNQRIYNNLLKREDGQRPRLGDLIRMSKNPSSNNYLNFALLGDPALRLSFPVNEVITESVNNKTIGVEADTVHALSMVKISGHIAGPEGNRLEDFQGYLYPKVFDKPSHYATLGNDGNSYPEEFDLMDKVLFEGKVSVQNGRFDFTFMVPRDIAYQYDFGKISYYAVDTNNMEDAWGAYENFFIGGIDETAEQDDQGPEIDLFLDDQTFQSGDITSSSPLLLANIRDEHGINYTGHSLGRDITMVMDQDWSNTLVMNDHFNMDLDSFTSGELTYLFENLDEGWHTITLKAWDLQNNSSEKTIDFFVDDAAEIILSEVVNFPNPFSENTTFGFVHNKNGAVLEVEVKIYDLNGRFIGSLKERASGSGFTPIYWNGQDQYGNEVPAGFYSYQLIVSDTYGNTTVQRQKMIKFDK